MEPWHPREITGDERSTSESKKIREILTSEIEETRIRPWMLSIAVLILIGVQTYVLASSDHEAGGLGYSMLALFAAVSLIDFFLAPRFIYFSWLATFHRQGMEGLTKAFKGSPFGINVKLGRDLIVQFTMIGMASTALGFVAGFIENNLWISLPFHALALIHIFRFQIRLQPFIDRLSWNLALAEREEPEIRNFFKLTNNIYSKP